MRVTFYTQQKQNVAATDEKPTYKDVLYAAISEGTELQFGVNYYRVRGLRVEPPVENPPQIEVTLQWIRSDASYCDCD